MVAWRPIARFFSALAAAALLLAPAAPALAQQKPPPPEVVVPPPPEVNIGPFKQAYEAAGRPVVLTLVGFSTGAREALRVEKTLWDTDATGFTFQLRSAFNEFINPPEADLELVSPTQLSDAVNRIQAQLNQRKELEAIALLAEQSRAELIILIRLFGDPGAGVPNRGQVEVTNARGRELFSFPFQWTLGTDTVSIRKVARLLAISFTEDYAKRANTASKRWTLRIFDLNDPEILTLLTDRLQNDTRGIKSIRARAGSAGTRDAFREFEVNTSLDPLALETAVTRAIKERQLAAETISTEGGVVNLRVRAARGDNVATIPVIRECIEVITDKDNPEGRKRRDELALLYTRRQQPSFAVLINRRPTTERERRDAVAAAGGNIKAENLILVTGQGVNQVNGGGGATPAPATDPNATKDVEFQTIGEMNYINYSLETNVYDMLGTELLNFNRRVDGMQARARLREVAQNQKTVFSEEELPSLLRQADVAEFYILATGTIIKDQGDEFYNLKYSFRLLNRNGQVVATAPDVIGFASRNTANEAGVRIVTKGAGNNANMPAFTVQQMAQQAVAKMACELLNEWQRNIQINVTLKGLGANTDFLEIERIYRENAKDLQIIGDPRNQNVGGGQGTLDFTISYPSKLSFTDVQREILRLNDKLPFDLIFESGDVSSGMIVNIKRR